MMTSLLPKCPKCKGELVWNPLSRMATNIICCNCGSTFDVKKKDVKKSDASDASTFRIR